MKQIVVLVPYDLVERAFQQVDVSKPSPAQVAHGTAKLYANPVPVIEAAIGDAWLKVQGLVGRCAQHGKRLVQQEVNAFMQYVETTSKELGAKANEFRLRLLDKIQEMMRDTFDLMLKALRTEVEVGQRKLTLKSIDLEQKLTYSASLEVSLTSLCEFASGGELTVKASYEAK